jgi:TonB family protein
MVLKSYINKKCQNCGSLRGVGHANECDCCGGDVWVFVCSKHQLFSLTSASCPLCETEISYSSQEKKWVATQQLTKSSKRPYKTFLILGIIIGSVLMYNVRNLELYESKQVQVKRQMLATQTSLLEVANTEIAELEKLLITSNDNFDELVRENNELNTNLYRYNQGAAADKALINDEILQLKSDIQKTTEENRELSESVTSLRNSTAARHENAQKQQIVDTNRYYYYHEVDIKPIPVVEVKPINPKRGLFGPSSGSTKVKVLIGKTGIIINTQLLNSTHKKFTKATFEALKKWKFSPGEIQGKKVKVEMELNFNFGSDN